MILWNVYSFFVTYANVDKWTPEKIKESDNILDRWIISELNVTSQIVGGNLDHFNIVPAARQIQRFNEELSTWYLRRSRKRRDDGFYGTLYNVLKNLCIISAPFIPFTAEEIFQNLKSKRDPESVHLCDWPKDGDVDISLVGRMAIARRIAEQAHAIRSAEKIKVRQPLQKATIKQDLEFPEILEILKDEINVKEIIVNKNIKSEIELDTELTAELKEEGIVREIIRQIQETRKKAGFKPGEIAEITLFLNEDNKKIFQKNKEEILKATNISKINFLKTANENTKI